MFYGHSLKTYLTDFIMWMLKETISERITVRFLINSESEYYIATRRVTDFTSPYKHDTGYTETTSVIENNQ